MVLYISISLNIFLYICGMFATYDAQSVVPIEDDGQRLAFYCFILPFWPVAILLGLFIMLVNEVYIEEGHDAKDQSDETPC